MLPAGLGISYHQRRWGTSKCTFNAQRCSEPDLSGLGLPALDGQCRVHSLSNLTECVLGMSIQEGPYSALVDARATMSLYLWDRRRIEWPTEQQWCPSSFIWTGFSKSHNTYKRFHLDTSLLIHIVVCNTCSVCISWWNNLRLAANLSWLDSED